MKNFRPKARPKKSSLISGEEAVRDALKSGTALDRIYVYNKLSAGAFTEVKRLAAQNSIPVNYVPVEKLNSFNVPDHNGCVAIISRVKYMELQEVISFVVENGEVPFFVLLDGITDVRNIGAIARTAYSTGVQAIIIPAKGVGALNEDAVLTSAGALEKMPICRVNSLMKAVDELHLNGVRVLASEMTAEKNLFQLDLKEPVAFVMGSEEKGIYPALMKVCDERFKIPMRNNFESLNVSVATGIILYEAMKQRMGA